MRFIPFISEVVKLKTTDKELFKALKSIAEEGFDLTRTQAESDTLFVTDFNKQYEAEIYSKSFRARRLNKSGYQMKGSNLKTTIYGKLIQEGDILTIRFIIAPNVFSSIIWVLILIITPYILYDTLFISRDNDPVMWFVMLLTYPMLIWAFNSDANEDQKFIDKLIAKTPH